MADDFTITTRSEGLLGQIGQWGAALITDEELLEALAAHDAEVRAGVVSVGSGGSCQHVAEEPEWAVSVARTTGFGDPVIYDFPDRLAAERFIENPPLWFSREDNQTKTLVSRRKAGPWVPVDQEHESGDER